MCIEPAVSRLLFESNTKERFNAHITYADMLLVQITHEMF